MFFKLFLVVETLSTSQSHSEIKYVNGLVGAGAGGLGLSYLLLPHPGDGTVDGPDSPGLRNTILKPWIKFQSLYYK